MAAGNPPILQLPGSKSETTKTTSHGFTGSMTRVSKLVSGGKTSYNAESQGKSTVYTEDNFIMGDTVFFKSKTWMPEGCIKLYITYTNPREKTKKNAADFMVVQLIRATACYRVDFEEDKMKINIIQDDGQERLERSLPLNKNDMPCWLAFKLRCGRVMMMSGKQIGVKSEGSSGYFSDSVESDGGKKSRAVSSKFDSPTGATSKTPDARALLRSISLSEASFIQKTPLPSTVRTSAPLDTFLEKKPVSASFGAASATPPATSVVAPAIPRKPNESEDPAISQQPRDQQSRTSGPLDTFREVKQRLVDEAKRHQDEAELLSQERLAVQNSLAEKQLRKQRLTDEIHAVTFDINTDVQRLQHIDKTIQKTRIHHDLIQQELREGVTKLKDFAGTQSTLTESDVPRAIVDPQPRHSHATKPSEYEKPKLPTRATLQQDNRGEGRRKFQRVSILSEKEVNTVAKRLFPLQGITFVGANDKGGLLVLIEAAFKTSTEPLVRALVGGIHCTIEAVNGFRLHTLQRGDAVPGLSRTAGFVAKVGDTPVLLTAAHNLERYLSFSCSVDRSTVDTRTEKMVEYFNYDGVNFQGDNVVGIGVISTCKRKCNEEPVSTTNQQTFHSNKRRYSTGEVDDILQICRHCNRNPASDVAVLKLDKYETTNPENGLAPSLSIIQDPAVLFATYLYKRGSSTGLTYGRVKSVNGTLGLEDLPGVSYRNVLLIEPVACPAFSEPGDSGSGVLILPREGDGKKKAAALVLGGENPTPSAEKPPYALCIMLKDSLDALKGHPSPEVNGHRIQELRILEATLLTHDENNN